jgi:sigma-B regulation protein RsbU (phosphoserine phosphatase)
MSLIDPQLTASYVLRVLRSEALYLSAGAAFTTIGLVAGAFSVLRRRLDPLLIYFALFAILYGSRLWLQSPVIAMMLPGSLVIRVLAAGINYVVPIPAFFFFWKAGFMGRYAKTITISLTVIYLGLLVSTLVFGPSDIAKLTNNVLIIICLPYLLVRSMLRKGTTRDFRVIRGGLFFFVSFALIDNLAQAFQHGSRLELFGFIVLLGCLGYVAGSQTLHREAQLGEIQKELVVAKRIQLSILPEAFPPSVNFRVTARYQPMTAVAGDFYDFLIGDGDHAGLLIADVSGHGVPAALIASMVKMAVKMAATSPGNIADDPAALLAAMNAALCGNTQQQFVTAAYVYLDAERGELRYSAAAHPPLLLLRNGNVQAIEENGLMLAAFSFASYTNVVHALQPGDRLLLYTDGIVEASNAAREEFGQERLQALLRTSAGRPQAETVDLILGAVRDWAVSQDDDLTLLVCDYGAG